MKKPPVQRCVLDPQSTGGFSVLGGFLLGGVGYALKRRDLALHSVQPRNPLFAFLFGT